MAVGGVVLAVIGNFMHPRSTDYYGDPVAWMDHNTPSTIWFPSHVLILLGAIMLTGGFVALSRSMAGTRGYGIANLALANALIGTTLIIVTLAIDGLAVAKLEQAWGVDTAPSPDAVLSANILYHTIFSLLYVFWITVFALAPIFFAVAMLLSKAYEPRFSWAGVLLGSISLVAALLSMLGVATEFIDAVVWTFSSALVNLWFLITGVLLWRRAS